jgi:hypothetical protein
MTAVTENFDEAEREALRAEGHERIARLPKYSDPPEEDWEPPSEIPNGFAARAPRPAGRDFVVEMLDHIAIGDEPPDLVKGLLPLGPTFGVVHGAPKSLKSFLLMHMGLVIASERDFCGRKVQGGAVVYITSEGIRGVRRRLIAMRQASNLEGHNVPFLLVSTMPNLGEGTADREALRAAIETALRVHGVDKPIRLIVVDTLRRAMPGKSENEQKDVSIVVDNLESIARHFGALVLAVHHSPRSDDRRGSGSNAIDAAADVMWSVTREEGSPRAIATVVRFKDGEEGDAWSFELQQREIGTASDGSPISSCHVEIIEQPNRKSDGAKPARAQPSPKQRRVYDIVVEAIAAEGLVGADGEAAPKGTRAVTRETAKRFAKQKGWWDSTDKNTEKSSNSNWNARLNELAGKSFLGLTETCVWIAAKPA